MSCFFYVCSLVNTFCRHFEHFLGGISRVFHMFHLDYEMA